MAVRYAKVSVRVRDIIDPKVDARVAEKRKRCVCETEIKWPRLLVMLGLDSRW